MNTSRPNPRAEYREQENQRVKESASLAETFRGLKSLTVDLARFSPESVTRKSEIKYTVNLANAKALFRFSCSNEECVGGDFDLSAELARAVAAGQTTVAGELICQGWSNSAVIGQEHCRHVLRYKLSAEYGREKLPAGRELVGANRGAFGNSV